MEQQAGIVCVACSFPSRLCDRTDTLDSTIAQNFALDLDSMFGLGAAEGVNNLSMSIQEK